MDDLDKRSKELMDYLILIGSLRNKRIIEAFKEVPRHHFVLRGYLHYAYDDTPLPIVNSATISEPKTVAYMLELLQPKRGDKVLEIGTGSGWQACLLSRCVGDSGKVVTIEIDKEVFEFGTANIEKMKLKNIISVHGDGSVGYEKEAPYDKIIYAVATPETALQVVRQLKIGGRAVAPVGTRSWQVVKRIDRISETKIEERNGEAVTFSELKGKLGY